MGVLVDTMTTEDDDFDVDEDDKLNNNLRRQQQQMQIAAEQGRHSTSKLYLIASGPSDYHYLYQISSVMRFYFWSSKKKISLSFRPY